jgi:hypothetical protein
MECGRKKENKILLKQINIRTKKRKDTFTEREERIKQLKYLDSY